MRRADLQSCWENQCEEIEALQAVYGESFVTQGERAFRFRHPLPTQREAFADFSVTYPDFYPRVSPNVEISVSGLPPATVQRAVERATAALPDLEGACCIFQLAAALDEALEEELGAPGLGAASSAPAAPPAGAPEPAAAPRGGLLPGDPTTPESFAAWWDSFRRARGIVLESDPEYEAAQRALRPTGREIWLEREKAGGPFVEEDA